MKTALVTGASRGVGRGVAISLAQCGYKVFATGRTIDNAVLPGSIERIRCDHQIDTDTAHVFDVIQNSATELDLLVTCAWGGYERMVENGVFTWTAPFWEQPDHRWTSMIDGGIRAAFKCAVHAAKMMSAQHHGLIVHISYWAAQRYLANVIYGIAKAATDKMTSDMAHELAEYNVAVLSLYPGLVRTEAVLAANAAGVLDITNSESPEFIGRVIDKLACDPTILQQSGLAVVAAKMAMDLGVHDIDGAQPEPLTIDSAG